ncbi:MAG TPA: hypothetical protein VM577_09105 [Anaerovoracaceae bacterium]|nr:hypothetical protein [Anaerovoracaceae bacterium]
MVKRKIAIAGKANSGKNTIADLIGQQIGLTYKIFAFADPMKEMIMKMIPQTDREVLWGPSHLRMTPTPNSELTYRHLLLDIGKLGRSYDPNIWINATIHMVQDYVDGSLGFRERVALIADVRFKNELKAVKENDFLSIRVVRPNSVSTTTSTDISEVDLDDVPDSEFDVVLTNDGTMEDLKAKIKDIVNTYL